MPFNQEATTKENNICCLLLEQEKTQSSLGLYSPVSPILVNYKVSCLTNVNIHLLAYLSETMMTCLFT